MLPLHSDSNYQKGNENVQINSFTTLQEEHSLLTDPKIVVYEKIFWSCFGQKILAEL